MNSAFLGDLMIRYDDQPGVSPAGAGVVQNLHLHEEVGAVEVVVETEGSVESAGDEERSHSEATECFEKNHTEEEVGQDGLAGGRRLGDKADWQRT